MNSGLSSKGFFHLQCTSSPHGVVYMAAKKHYFGVGGGTRRFLSLVEKDGELVLLNMLTENATELCHTKSCMLFLCASELFGFVFFAN